MCIVVFVAFFVLFLINSSQFLRRREKMLAASPSMSDTRLAQVRAGRKQSKEREALRKENLLQRQELDLELNIRQLQYELQVCGNAKKMLFSL